MSMRPRRKLDKFWELFSLHPRTSRGPEPFVTSTTPTIPSPRPQLAGDAEPTVLNPKSQIPSVQPGKVFVKGESFTTDMAILFAAYTLQESPELKKLIQLIVIIRDNDSDGQLTDILETCTRFSVHLASAPDDYRAEAAQAIILFHNTVLKVKTIHVDGDGNNIEELTNMVHHDIDKIKPSFIDNNKIPVRNGLSRVLDITIGPTIYILSLIKNASLLVPVPWVQPLIGTVVDMLQAISQTRANYKEMSEIAAKAGDFVISCAVICSSEVTVGSLLENSLKKFNKSLQSIAEECNELHQLGLFSRYLHQSGHLENLQGIRKRLDDAIQLFQTENCINIKLDTEELHRKIDLASLNTLPSHPRYTRNEYLEKSRDDVLEYLSDWIATAPELVLWVHGAAGLGKSTVAQELVYLLKSEDRLAGGVFLTHLTSEPPETVVQMISRQLGEMYPSAVPRIAEAARKLQGPHNSLRDYFTAYLFYPIRALNYPYQLVIVIDGLDEWRNYEAFLAELVNIPSPSPIKIILTSRFNYSIERGVKKTSSHTYALPPASPRVIERYFHHHFSSGNIDWRGRKPDEARISLLAARADGLLIWAATARLLIMNKFSRKYPHEILDQILSSEENVVSGKGRAEDTQLQRLYRNTVSTLFPPEIREELRTFLSASLVLQEALPITDFVRLSGISGPVTEEIHQRLAALQTQGNPKNGLVSPAMQRFHASFIDFLTTNSDDDDNETLKAISIPKAHDTLAKSCLDIVFVDFFQSFRGKTSIYSQLHGVELYAVKFWPLHFSSGTLSEHIKRELDAISPAGMHQWASLFLPSIAARFRDRHYSFKNIEKSALPYRVAMVIGKEDVTTLSYFIHSLRIAIQLQPLDLRTITALAFSYHELYEISRSNRDLEEEIEAFRQALGKTPRRASKFFLATLRNNLAHCLQTRFNQQGTLDDLNKAISLYREALLLIHMRHPHRSTCLNNLGHSLETRFNQQGASNDLDEAISLNREALLLRPAHHPGRSISLNNLAASLKTRFLQQGSSHDLDETISISQEALLLLPAPHPYYFISLNDLAISLQFRFVQRGSSNDLDEAISMHRQVLLSRPAPHPNRWTSLNNLGVALQTRFEEQGAPDDLDEAISLHREALLILPAPHPDRWTSLSGLGISLESRFKQQGAPDDLDEAISLHQEALLLRPAPYPDRWVALNNLATSLATSFDQVGDPNDLDKAISMSWESLLLQPAPHPARSRSLNNLAAYLVTRFEQQGSLNDLDEAISVFLEALLLMPARHLHRPRLLNNLADSLLVRFCEKGSPNDLDEVISIYREVLLLMPVLHLHHWSRSLNNLASSLLVRFHQKGSPNDLDEVISIFREVLLLMPVPRLYHQLRSRNNLATYLVTRFEQQGSPNDLDEAISIYREILLLCPASYPHRWTPLVNLASLLYTRFDQGRILPDLIEAITLYQQFFDCSPDISIEVRTAAQEEFTQALKDRDALVGRITDSKESNAEGQLV